MQREGSALSGVGTVFFKEMTDNLTSARMRLLEILIFVTGISAVYVTIGSIKEQIGQDPFIFLRVFTLSKAPLISFVDFLGFLIPIVAIALGFDAVNSEFNRRTMSRILAQPIYRDALLFGKFLSGLTTLAVVLAALWLLVTGLGILTLGLPPSGEEVLRGLAFLLTAIAYGGVWLALALMFSVIFRSAATAALASLAIWLLFAFFWQMIVPIITQAIAPPDPYDLSSIMHTTNVALTINRLSPNILFLETTHAFLEPSTQSLNPLLIYISQVQNAQNAIPGSPLPIGQSIVLVWPQLTGLIAGVIVLFSVTYVLFQRQEVRA